MTRCFNKLKSYDDNLKFYLRTCSIPSLIKKTDVMAEHSIFCEKCNFILLFVIHGKWTYEQKLMEEGEFRFFGLKRFNKVLKTFINSPKNLKFRKIYDSFPY